MEARKKILLIDDTASFLYILNHMLSDDYDKIFAKNGEEGLDMAKEIMPDLILLDIVMPGISGYDVLKTLKADEEMKHIPVVLITGNDSEIDKSKGHELGATAYITKPFKKAVVKKTIESVLL